MFSLSTCDFMHNNPDTVLFFSARTRLHMMDPWIAELAHESEIDKVREDGSKEGIILTDSESSSSHHVSLLLQVVLSLGDIFEFSPKDFLDDYVKWKMFLQSPCFLLSCRLFSLFIGIYMYIVMETARKLYNIYALGVVL